MSARDERQKAASRAWKKANPERHAELARAYRLRNKAKTQAQNLLNYAVRTGQMSRGPCEKCGTTERVHAHHDDYREPYRVHWLCYLCHKAGHPVSAEDKKVKFEGAQRGDFRGEQNTYSKLTNEQIRQIRACLKAGMSQENIGKAFGITQTTVSKIKTGITWSHVK
jgi:Helix-turn-helix